MDVSVIVPGHGPITDKAGVRGVRDYLTYVDAQARQRFDSGMGLDEAVRDIALGAYQSWLDPERIAINVATLYKEYAGDSSPPNVIQLFTRMSEIWRAPVA